MPSAQGYRTKRWSTLLIGLLVAVSLWPATSAQSQAIAPSAQRSSTESPAPVAENVTNDEIQDFKLVSAREGWVLINQQLYWTHDGGSGWTDITPHTEQSTIRTVFFLDAQHGWAVLTSPEVSGTSAYTLAQTADAGKTWQAQPLSLFAPDDVDALVSDVYLHFVNSHTGWLVTRRGTSRNFTVGALFQTTDGGNHWTRLAIPIAEPVYFATDQLGWVAGGPAGDELYRTQDGGRTWTRQSVDSSASGSGVHRSYRLPRLDTPRAGTLPVIATKGIQTSLELYTTDDGGQQWKLSSTTPFTDKVDPNTRFPLAALGAGQWAAVVPSTGHLLRAAGNGQTSEVRDSDGTSSHLVEIDAVTAYLAWGHYKAGNCEITTQVDGRRLANCTSESKLVKTTDGGQTWQTLTLPRSNTPAAQGSTNALITVAGQGFDTCLIPSLEALNTWISSSPYRAVNLYIGGSVWACRNSPLTPSRLTASYLRQVSQQGWTFFPTWVGPQAPCYSDQAWMVMSYDPATAFNQGVAEANAASDALANLGLPVGSIVHYDMEGYMNNSLPNLAACRTAVKSFVSGWSRQMRARGNLAGLYGGVQGTAMQDFATISDVPDEVWLAHWIYPSYNPAATVWDPDYVDNTLWSNHQRLRQYSGGHNETWGGVTLNIDSDVLDGTVVTLDVQPQPPTITTPHSGDIITSSPLTIQLTGSNVSKVQFWAYYDGSWHDLGTDANGADGWSVTWNCINVRNQAVTLTTWMWDTSNKLTVNAGGYIPVTLNLPFTGITSPHDGDTISPSPLPIQFTGTSVSKVQFWANYDGSWHDLGTDANGSDGWSVTWNWNGVANQPVILSTWMWDTNNTLTIDAGGYVYVTLKAPSWGISTPASGATITTCPLSLQAAGNGVGKVQFWAYYDGGWHDLGTDANGTNGWSVPWNCTNVRNQALTLTTWMWDTSNNLTINAGGYLPITLNHPPIGMTSPNSGTTVTTSPLSLQFTGSNVGKVQFWSYYDGSWHDLGTDTNGSDGWSMNWNWNGVANQPVILSTWMWDSTNTLTIDAGGYVHITLRAPSWGISTPASGTTITTCPLSIQAAGNGVGKVQFWAYYDGGWHDLGTDANGADGWSVPWNCTNVRNQAVTLTTWMWDTSNNLTVNAGGYIPVTLNHPPVGITAPHSGDTITTSPLSLQFTGSNVKRVQFWASYNGSWHDLGTDTNGADGWSISWNWSGVRNQTVTLSTWMWDTSDTLTVDAGGYVYVTLQGTWHITTPASGATVTSCPVTLQAWANGASKVQFWAYYGSAWHDLGTDSNGADGWSVSWTCAGVANQAVTLTTWMWDTSDKPTINAGGYLPITLNVPVPGMSAPANGAIVTPPPLTIQFTGSNVSKVQFWANYNGSWHDLGTDTNGADGWSMSWNWSGIGNQPVLLSTWMWDTNNNLTIDAGGYVGITFQAH